MTVPIQSDTPPYTADEIRGRLAISTAVYQNERLSAGHIAGLAARGIRRIEVLCNRRSFDHGHAGQVDEVLEACRAECVTVSAVHGPLDLPYRDAGEEARRQVVEDSLGAIRFAEEAGARVYVGHFGHADHAQATVAALLTATDGFGVRLTTENQMGRPLAPYAEFVNRMACERFGLTVDIGHVRNADGVNPFTVDGSARSAFVDAAGAMCHVHLHESFDIPVKPDHRPPLHPEGVIRWGEVFAGLRDVGYTRDFLFEDGRGEGPELWVRMTAEFPETFVARFVDKATKRS